jgi:hypothetical protein
MLKTKILLAILIFGLVGIGLVFAHHYFLTRNYLTVSPQFLWMSKVKDVSLWQNGGPVSLNSLEGFLGKLATILEKINLQAKCVFFEERINQLKENGKVVEMDFNSPVDIRISQWIEPEERNRIKTNNQGFRILKNVEKVIFVLKGDLEGNILIGRKWQGKVSYGCWAIRKAKSDEIDKSWIDEIEKQIGRVAKQTKIENSAREVVEKFMISRTQRNYPLAQSFLSENAEKEYEKPGLTLIGTSNPHFASYKVLKTEKLSDEEFKFKVRIFENYENSPAGYFDEDLIAKKIGDKYLIDNAKRGEYKEIINFKINNGSCSGKYSKEQEANFGERKADETISFSGLVITSTPCDSVEIKPVFAKVENIPTLDLLISDEPSLKPCTACLGKVKFEGKLNYWPEGVKQIRLVYGKITQPHGVTYKVLDTIKKKK